VSKHTFNLAAWLNRLGIKGSAVPELAPVVVPVQVVGDASLLVPSLLPATAAYGTSRGASAGNHSTLQVHSRADGGTIIRTAQIHIAANSSFAWAVLTTSQTWAASGALTAQNFGPVPVTSIVTGGDVAAVNKLNPNDNPCGYSTSRSPRGPEDLIYLPRNYYFVLQNEVAATATRFELVIQDLPAAEGPE
jgi:hypothetical protein